MTSHILQLAAIKITSVHFFANHSGNDSVVNFIIRFSRQCFHCR